MSEPGMRGVFEIAFGLKPLPTILFKFPSSYFWNASSEFQFTRQNSLYLTIRRIFEYSLQILYYLKIVDICVWNGQDCSKFSEKNAIREKGWWSRWNAAILRGCNPTFWLPSNSLYSQLPRRYNQYNSWEFYTKYWKTLTKVFYAEVDAERVHNPVYSKMLSWRIEKSRIPLANKLVRA